LIDQVPTQNIEAYSAYLRGLKLRDTGGHNTNVVVEVIEAFEQATKLDPQFALAWAQLSIELSRYAQGSRDPARQEAALAARTRVEQLQPELYEVELARVVYLYRVQFEYQQALDALEALEEKHTLGASALMLKAFLLRRLCRFEEAYQMVTAAKKLDPRSIQTVSQVITMAWEVDDCDASSAYARAAMALAADVLVVGLSVARSELQCNGNGQRANELLKDSEFNGFFQVLIAEMAAAAARDWSRLLAISEYSLPQEGPLFSTIGQLDGALALRNLNRTQDANAFMDSVKEKMEAVEVNPLIVESSVFARIKSFYFAFQGDKDATREWVMETKQRREKENRGDQALKVSQYLYDARILTLAGLHSEAIEELRLSLESPGGDRFPLIDALPIFDVLKEDSGYIASRQRYADAD
jgi:tetratricopeptide (TPR) repeat protein